MSSGPKISIITPSFNQSAYIESTILSVLAQRYDNYEHIIVDNRSTDGTDEILSRYADRLTHVVVEADTGQSNALNKGFALATGGILTWLNSDDMLAPGALSRVAETFSANPDADMVVGSLLYMVDGRIEYQHLTSAASGLLELERMLDVNNEWLEGKYFFQPEVFFKRALFEQAGGYVDEALHYSMDYDLWVRFAAEGARMAVTGAPLAIFRAHPNQKTFRPEDYKPELMAHTASLRARYGLRREPPQVRARRPGRIAFVIDVPEGGAALAHGRLYQVLSDAKFETLFIHAREAWSPSRPPADIGHIKDQLHQFHPDLVIVGNLHGVTNGENLLSMLSETFACSIYMHDLWLITGRCTYTRGCEKLLSHCDERCPTAAEYPAAPPARISDLHSSKLEVLTRDRLKVIANSGWMAGQVSDYGKAHGLPSIEGAPVPVIPPPMDLVPFLHVDRAAARRALGLLPGADVLVCSAAAFNDRRKGFSYIIDAVRALAGMGLSPVVLFVGWADPAVREQAADLDNCLFLGYAPAWTLPAVYGAADILLSGAIDEAFGMVYAEAAAAGAWTVAFRSAGIPEAVCPGISGILVDQFSGVELAKAVAGLILRKRAGENLPVVSRAWAAAQFPDILTVQRVVRHLFEDRGLGDVLYPRTQLHRSLSLDDTLNLRNEKPAEERVPSFVTRQTHVKGLGEIEYAISSEGWESFSILRIMIVQRMLEPDDEGYSSRRFSFKLLHDGNKLHLDLRPNECEPPIYTRALVEHGRPFLSDDWGPTLMIEVGSRKDLAAVQACLPQAEFDRLARFFAMFLKMLRSPGSGVNFAGVLLNEKFPVDHRTLISKLAAWVDGDISTASPAVRREQVRPGKDTASGPPRLQGAAPSPLWPSRL